MENRFTITLSSGLPVAGHPWVSLGNLSGEFPEKPCVATLVDPAGEPLGSGLFDPSEPERAWRRFSMAEGVHFDESYLATAIDEALGRRSDESYQRLVSSDADYLPGLEVEYYEGILQVCSKHPVIDVVLDEIVGCLRDACEPKEIVLIQGADVSTLSGQNLKARWVEIDGLHYRVDCLNPQKPRFFLDQREQHALVGSLCEGRTVLDGFAHSGAFALQAARNGAEHVVAVDSSEACTKAIGAAAQKNGTFVESIQADVAAFLAERKVGELDAIILDPPAATSFDVEAVSALHEMAFHCLPPGGLLATYCRTPDGFATFDTAVAQGAAAAGRHARLFAQTAQPFDFPVLLNFPQSRHLKGLILQVE